MPTKEYKVWAWGSPVGIGVTGANYVGIAGVAKRASDEDPRIVANEIVCNSLARALHLPCPPGATLDREGIPYFFSLDFNLAGEALPPADPVAIVTHFPRLSWGIVLFDALIMNFDRHEENIAFDTDTNRLQIFDHSHAFLHAGKLDVSETLASHDGQLCIGRHCLAAELCELDGLDLWAMRISQIPDFFIEDTISSVTDLGLPLTHKSDCIQFLKKRRLEIGEIVEKHKDQFPKLPRVLA